MKFNKFGHTIIKINISNGSHILTCIFNNNKNILTYVVLMSTLHESVQLAWRYSPKLLQDR